MIDSTRLAGRLPISRPTEPATEPMSGLESCADHLDGLSYPDDPDALILAHPHQRPVPGDDEIGLRCESRSDDHIVIRIGRDARPTLAPTAERAPSGAV